jgi:hypothetical protein
MRPRHIFPPNIDDSVFLCSSREAQTCMAITYYTKKGRLQLVLREPARGGGEGLGRGLILKIMRLYDYMIMSYVLCPMSYVLCDMSYVLCDPRWCLHASGLSPGGYKQI